MKEEMEAYLKIMIDINLDLIDKHKSQDDTYLRLIASGAKKAYENALEYLQQISEPIKTQP